MSSPSHGQQVHEGALITYITRSMMPTKGRVASQQTLLARQRAMADLIDALPTPDIGDFLVSECKAHFHKNMHLNPADS